MPGNGPYDNPNYEATGQVGAKQQGANAPKSQSRPSQPAASSSPPPSGGGGTDASPQKLPVTDEEVRTYLQENYGMYAAFWDDPEIGQILRDAARHGYSQQRLLGALSTTAWWQRSTQASRAWQGLLVSDPGEAQHRIDERYNALKQQAAKLGIPIDDNRLRTIVDTSLRLGWSDGEIQHALVSEMPYDPHAGGAFGSTLAQVRDAADSYGLQISDQQAFRMARDIQLGDQDLNSITQGFKAHASALYQGLAPLLDKGITVRDFFQPYKDLISQELEVAPDTIQLTDPKYQRFLDTTLPNGTHTYASISDARKIIRNDPTYGWDKTQAAGAADAELASRLGKEFGLAS